MPSSIAHQRCPCRMRSSVSGTPMSLLRLPAVASTASSPALKRRIDASISFTVVLPFEPATAISAGRNRARQCRARTPSARRGSGDPAAGGGGAAAAAAAAGGGGRRPPGRPATRPGGGVVRGGGVVEKAGAVEAPAAQRDEKLA